MNAPKPRLLVGYDDGSASPFEIASAVSGRCQLTFVVDTGSDVASLLPVLRDHAEVVVVGADPPADVDRLKRRAPDGITTFSERMLRRTAAVAAALGLPFHRPETAELLTDKYLQRQALRDAGVDSVRSRRLAVPDQWADAVRYVGLPAVVKPAVSEGSRNTYRVDDEATGAGLVARLLAQAEPGGRVERELVVEEFLRGRDCGPYGDYVSVESAVCAGSVIHFAVTGKLPLVPPFREVGHFWPADLPAEELLAIEVLVERALGALGVQTGLAHTEVKLTDAGPRIIEVNGRLGGLMNLLSRGAAGVDMIEVAGRLALGERVERITVPADSVYFLHHNPVPTVSCRLEAVHGAPSVRKLRNVVGYRTVIRPGTEIDDGVQTRWLDVLQGRARDHREMLETLETVLDTLEFTFVLPTGTERVTARTLRRRCWTETGTCDDS